MKRKNIISLVGTALTAIFLLCCILCVQLICSSDTDNKDTEEIVEDTPVDTVQQTQPVVVDETPTVVSESTTDEAPDTEAYSNNRYDLNQRDKHADWADVDLVEVDVDVDWLELTSEVPGYQETALWYIIDCMTDMYNGDITDTYSFDIDTDCENTDTPYVYRYTLHSVDQDLTLEVDTITWQYRVL